MAEDKGALGLIETRGLVAAIEASDAALKAADTVLAQIEFNDPAMPTVKLRGNVADVKSAVDAGAAAARRVGEVLSAHVIARPHDDIEILVNHTPQMTAAGMDAMATPKKTQPKTKKK